MGASAKCALATRRKRDYLLVLAMNTSAVSYHYYLTGQLSYSYSQSLVKNSDLRCLRYSCRVLSSRMCLYWNRYTDLYDNYQALFEREIEGKSRVRKQIYCTIISYYVHFISVPLHPRVEHRFLRWCVYIGGKYRARDATHSARKEYLRYCVGYGGEIPVSLDVRCCTSGKIFAKVQRPDMYA